MDPTWARDLAKHPGFGLPGKALFPWHHSGTIAGAQLTVSRMQNLDYRSLGMKGLAWSRKKFWFVAFCIWTLVSLVHSSTVYLSIRAESCPLTDGQVFSYTFVDHYLWMLLCPAVLWMAHRYPFEPGKWAMSFGFHLLAVTGLTVLQLTLFIAVYVPYHEQRIIRGTDFLQGFRLLGSTHLFLGFLTYGAIIIVALALHHRRQQEAALVRASELEAQLAQAQLQALRMQLHPHFLFNTLHTIASLVDEDPSTARRMTARLGEFLRLTLDASHAPEISLHQELDFLRHYLAIEQVRFGTRLKVVEVVAPDLLIARVPNLVLQPLVENAIRHGLLGREQGGTLIIRALHKEDRLQLQVEDNGGGLKGEPKWGVGLNNIHNRLHHLYGTSFGVVLSASPEGGVIASVELPLRCAEGH